MQARGDSLLWDGSQGQQSHPYVDMIIQMAGSLSGPEAVLSSQFWNIFPPPSIWHWGLHSRDTCSKPVHTELLSPHWSLLAQSFIPKE